jgi:hypothetical protein
MTAKAEKGKGEDVAAAQRERIDNMVAFFETLEKLSQRFVSPSGKGLQLAATMLSKFPDLGFGAKEEAR